MPDLITIKCLVVDDEPPAREILRRYIEQVPMLEMAGECGNAVQALTILQHQPIDLMFLDIRMPKLNGNDFLKTLKNPPQVIFTTAYTEYAMEGYELDIVDYLMKPIPFDRFLKAVNKAYHPANGKQDTPAPADETRNDSFVYFRADRKMIKVMLADILFIESMKDYIKVITTQGNIITKQSISSVEEMLPERDFVRIHRSFIVSVRKIKAYTNEMIGIERTELPIGKLYRPGVLKLLAGN